MRPNSPRYQVRRTQERARYETAASLLLHAHPDTAIAANERSLPLPASVTRLIGDLA